MDDPAPPQPPRTLPRSEVLDRLREEYWEQLSVAEDLDPGISPSSYLGLQIAGAPYAIPLAQCRNVLRLPRLARVPHAPRWLRGVLSLRGEILPVIDPRPLLGLEPGSFLRRLRVVVVHAGPLAAGLVADRIDEVWEFPGPAPRPRPGEIAVDLPDSESKLLVVEAFLEDAFVKLGKEVP